MENVRLCSNRGHRFSVSSYAARGCLCGVIRINPGPELGTVPAHGRRNVQGPALALEVDVLRS
jgi:hypothetical protein